MSFVQKKRYKWSFQFGDEPEFIHIVETGFVDRYYVMYEDAYEFCNQMQVESYSKQGIKDKFGIDIDVERIRVI